jgi:predicted nucleic acid-binding Zn ribbon protein
MTKRDLALDLFHSFQTQQNSNTKYRKKLRKESMSVVGDPQPIENLLSDLVDERDWRSGIAEGTLFSTWSSVVGPEISSHADPISLLDGVLTIQTSSTAWATQLQLVAPDLLATIHASAPGALVESVAIIGPQGPSWRKGIRTIRGARGPRDTYG